MRRPPNKILGCAGAAMALLLAATGPGLAEPPPWAPAHGYRAKQKSKPVAVSAAPAPRIEIKLGQCNGELLGSLIGGAAGAALGSTIGKGDGRLIAVAGGTLVGYLIGGQIGRAMDAADQRCIGQVLEHAPAGRSVAWRNTDTGSRYEVRPEAAATDAGGRICRTYTTTAVIYGRTEEVQGRACRREDGAWQIAS